MEWNHIPKCPECKTDAHVIEDSREGRKVCSKCGIIVQNYYLYEQSEWRNFSDKDGSSKSDPNRVGGFFDPMLSDEANLQTFIGTTESGEFNHLQKIQQMKTLSQEDKKKQQAVRKISKYCRQLSLNIEAKLLAFDLIEQIIKCGELSGKNFDNLIGAVLYISAKQVGCKRPLKELCGVMNVKRKGVSRMFSEIQKLKAAQKVTVKVNKKNRDSDVEQFTVKFAHELELPKYFIDAAKQTARNLHNLEIMPSHRPATSAACVIWALMKVKPHNKELQRQAETVAKACQVSERNFTQQFKNTLYPRLLDIIPNTDYFTKKEIARVSLK